MASDVLDRYPLPAADERPISYADRLGCWYARSASEAHKKELGQYLTPVEVARFMASSLELPDGGALRVLDPGAGAGILSCALCEAIAEHATRRLDIELEAYEVDGQLAGLLEICLRHAKEWLEHRGILLNATIHNDDFILAHASSLENPQLTLLANDPPPSGFDVAISNPPYFKLQKSDPRAIAASAVVHGQPNIYALFMAVTASILNPGGQMVFITPRSYASGPYFRLFRETLFQSMKPFAIHLFGSRRDAFRCDEVLQENVILTARREDRRWSDCNGDMVRISSCDGLGDLSHPRLRVLPLAEVLDWSSKDKVLRIPITEEDTSATSVVEEWPGSLRSYGMEISTGPIVPFRAKPLLAKEGSIPETHAPLLWMQSVTAMQVQWPAHARSKTQYIIVNKDSMPLLVADRNYVVMRRFSSKEQHRRLTAAPLLKGALQSPCIGLENHLNYVHRPGGSLSAEEAYGLASLFNSTLLDTFFRISNGNTQVSATELRAMPLPPIDAIREIGRRAMLADRPTPDVDDIVRSVLGHRRELVTEGTMLHGKR